MRCCDSTRAVTVPAILAAVSVLLPVAAGAQVTDPAADRYAEVRAEFITAYRDARLGVSGDADSRALQAYPLYAYLQAARIVRALETASGEPGPADDAATAFIATSPDEPISRNVRLAWLESLARRGLRQTLIDNWSPGVGGSALECRYLDARIAAGPTTEVEQLILDRWLTGSQLPPECEPVFEWARANGVINEDATAARVRLLLDNGNVGFARAIARRLPADRADPLLRQAALLEDPDLAFDALIGAPASAPDDSALIDAWARYARNRPTAALARIDPLLSALDPNDGTASLLRRALAFGLAWDRRSEALGFFSRVARRHLDDYAREWQARAALWAAEWPTADDAIAGMSDSLRGDAAWRYWAARSAHALGQEADARAGYEALLGDDNFYAALAAARLGRAYEPTVEPLRIDQGSLAQLAAMPAMIRARELWLAGLETDARREWNAAYADLTRPLQLAGIRLAASWGWHEIAVLTATRNGIFNDYALLYPQRYESALPDAGNRQTPDRHLLYGLIRQESLFSPNAVSSAGAIGLMQLQLETARRAAQRWQLERPSRATLFDPATNIALGAAQLRSLIDEFDGQLLPALAGYNAGYNAAARWLPEGEIDADIWVENIPYNETRAYVRRVLWHALVYRWLETARPQDAGGWLEPIRRP